MDVFFFIIKGVVQQRLCNAHPPSPNTPWQLMRSHYKYSKYLHSHNTLTRHRPTHCISVSILRNCKVTRKPKSPSKWKAFKMQWSRSTKQQKIEKIQQSTNTPNNCTKCSTWANNARSHSITGYFQKRSPLQMFISSKFWSVPSITNNRHH